MTKQTIIIEWDDEEVRTWGIHRMTHHRGPDVGYEYKAHLSRHYIDRDVHGHMIGDCWGHAVADTMEEAWAQALDMSRQMAQLRLADRNSKPPPAPSTGIITTTKSAEDLGL